MEVLEAVQMCLTEGAVLDAGVNSLTTPDGLRAQQMLERVRLSVLSQGQPFNTEKVTLVRNSNGTVVVPPNYLAMELPCPYVVRNRKIYHPGSRTHDVGRDFENLNAAMDVPFEQLPQIPAEYVAWEATRRFCASTRGASSAQYAYCERESNRAAVALSVEYPVKVTLQYGSKNIRRSGLNTRGRYAPEVDTSSTSFRWCSCSS